MEIRINCKNPSVLKNKIIKDSEDGELRTWDVRTGNNVGKILTHTADQYEDKALLVLTPDEKNNVLKGHLTRWEKSAELDYAIKAIYIGRFAQAVLTHYEQYFNDIEISK
jgi:hypothetical protein